MHKINFKQSNNNTNCLKTYKNILEPLLADSYKELLPLLAISDANKIDLGELMMTKYAESNLPLNRYMARSSLFYKVQENKTIKNMLKNHLNAYQKYICSPIPSIYGFPSNFSRFNDKIDITLQYLSKINQFMNKNPFKKTRPIQFDLYFIAPTAPCNYDKFMNDLECLKKESLLKSSPNYRFCNRCGINDIDPMLCSKESKRMLTDIDSDKRLVLLIVRRHKNRTNDDILYLFPQKLQYNLTRCEYKYNEVLWKINTKKDIIPNKLNIDDPKYCDSIFSISYHLHSTNNTKMYVYFNGFGQRMYKEDIIKKWPLLFVADRNKISNQVLTQFNDEQQGFNDFRESENKLDIDIINLFGLRYQYRRCRDCKNRILVFPRSMLLNSLNEITEFQQSQQLYYHLAWTCKMQLIDEEFMEYTLNNGEYGEIAIFNAELHTKGSNEELYVVAVLNDGIDRNHRNKAKWRMDAFMNAMEIYNKFGINADNLPIGSRYKHNYFENLINDNNKKFHENVVAIDWNKVPLIHSQKKHNIDRPNFNDIDLDSLLKESVDNICNKKDDLSLIPILSVDTKTERIYCDPLIPIKLPNECKWIAVSYKTMRSYPYKTVVTGLYIDPTDIINKAALVDPSTIYKYQWLKGEEINNNNNNNNNINNNKYNNQINVTFGVSYISPSNQGIQTNLIQSLQHQLTESLQREKLLLSMLHQQSVIRNNNNINNINNTAPPFNGFNNNNICFNYPSYSTMSPPVSSLQIQNVNTSHFGLTPCPIQQQ